MTRQWLFLLPHTTGSVELRSPTFAAYRRLRTLPPLSCTTRRYPCPRLSQFLHPANPAPRGGLCCLRRNCASLTPLRLPPVRITARRRPHRASLRPLVPHGRKLSRWLLCLQADANELQPPILAVRRRLPQTTPSRLCRVRAYVHLFPPRHTGAVCLPSKPSAPEYSRKRFSLQSDTPQSVAPLYSIPPRAAWALACLPLRNTTKASIPRSEN